MNLKTLNQERATFALKKVRENKDKKFATYAKKLPTLITTNGLILTLAFLKSKNESKKVYNSLQEWLKNREFIHQEEDALERLVEIDFSILRLATIEALLFSNWLKRMAEIEVEVDKE